MTIQSALNSLVNPPKNELKGVLGMSKSVVNVTSRPGFVWVRLLDNTSEMIKAHNDKVSPIYGLPVKVSYDGQRYEIVGVDSGRYDNWVTPSSFLPNHGGQHSAIRGYEGADPVWVDTQQFLPMLVMPVGGTGSNTVNVATYNYQNSDGVWGQVGNTGTFNLPGLSTTGSNVYLLMMNDADFSFYAITGSVFSSASTGTADVLSNIPVNALDTEDIPVAAIVARQNRPILWENIYDVRQFIRPRGGIAHMMQSDSTTQAIANVSNAQVVTFDTDVHHREITRTSSSRFTITKSGSYLIVISGIADTTAANNHLEIWLRVNGNDVANSNTRVQLVGTAETVVSVSFIQKFNKGDYFEFWTWGDNTGCRWLATAAGSSPTRPAVPSIIVTANLLSKD